MLEGKETQRQIMGASAITHKKTKNKCEVKLSISVHDNIVFLRNLILIQSIRYITLFIKINSIHKLQTKYILLFPIIYQMSSKFLLWRYECLSPHFSWIVEKSLLIPQNSKCI